MRKENSSRKLSHNWRGKKTRALDIKKTGQRIKKGDAILELDIEPYLVVYIVV